MRMLYDYDAIWRSVLASKGYISVSVDWRIDPVNDTIRLDLYWYNTEWSVAHIPQEMRRTTLNKLGQCLSDVTKYINDRPEEPEEREQALLRDFAAIKERIAASRYADMFAAETEALMQKMTTNILPAPDDKQDESGSIDIPL